MFFLARARLTTSAQVPLYAVREIKILKQVAHENIVKLKEIVVSLDPEDTASRNYA
jgi:serine/threonine protein kinase